MRNLVLEFVGIEEFQKDHAKFVKPQYHMNNIVDIEEQLRDIAEECNGQDSKFKETFYYTDEVMEDGIVRGFEFEIECGSDTKKITYQRCFEC